MSQPFVPPSGGRRLALHFVGLVVERKRLADELDGFMWFCENCNHKLYEEHLYISDIVGQLPPIFDRFYGSEQNRTCEECGTVMPKHECSK